MKVRRLSLIAALCLIATGAWAAWHSVLQVAISSGGGGCNPPLLSCVTVPSGLTLWLPLDDSTTSGVTSTDLSGNSFNGTQVGLPTSVTGQIQQGRGLNGSTQYIDETANSVSLPGGAVAFSIVTWFNPASAVDGVLVTNNTAGVERWELRYDRASSGKLNGVVGGTILSSVTTAASMVGNWNFSVLTGDGVAGAGAATLKLYVGCSGTPEATGMYSNQAVTGNWAIGTDVTNGGPFFNGSMDDPRIYNRAITGAEVTSICNAGIAGNP